MKTNVLILGTLAGTLEVLSNCKLVLFLLCVLVFLRVVIFFTTYTQDLEYCPGIVGIQNMNE